METQIGTLCANLHSRIHTIRQITPFTTFHTRLQLIKSIVIGKLTYALPTYTQITDKLNIRIHRVIMAAARTIIGNYCFKKSINYILDKCKLLDSKDMIAFASIKYINKILLHKTPRSIISNYLANNKRNTDNKLRTIYKPKTKKLGKHIIYRGAQLYNIIPSEIKNLPIKAMSKKLRIFIRTSNMWEVGNATLNKRQHYPLTYMKEKI